MGAQIAGGGMDEESARVGARHLLLEFEHAIAVRRV